MSRPILVRALTDGERQALEVGLRSSDASALRRCQILVASARGDTTRRIADSLGCSDQWVRNVRDTFNTDGLASLEPDSPRPHTIQAAFDAAACKQLGEVPHRSPREFGKPMSDWLLALVAEVCAEQGLPTAQLSRETIRQTLMRLGIHWQRAKHWGPEVIPSPDPQYAQKTAAGHFQGVVDQPDREASRLAAGLPGRDLVEPGCSTGNGRLDGGGTSVAVARGDWAPRRTQAAGLLGTLVAGCGCHRAALRQWAADP